MGCAALLACSSAQSSGGFGGPGGDVGDGGASGSSNSASGSGGGASSSGAVASSGGTASGSSGGAQSTTSGGSSGGGAMSGGAGDGGGPVITWATTLTADEVGPTVTLSAIPFTVAAGDEVYMCEVFNNPFAGVTTDLLSMHGTMSAGSHHFFLFSVTTLNTVVEPAVGTIGPCAGAGLEFHPFPFLSQQPDWTVNYPTDSEGKPMGYSLSGSNQVMINAHYLNASAESITANVSITITPAKAGVVQTHVGSIFLNNSSLSVPATATKSNPYQATETWSGGSGLPSTYSIFTSWSHMHQWGLKLSASTGSNAFYSETNWNSPGLFLHAPGMQEPPTATGPLSAVPMTSGSPITWDCSYFNDTGATLTFGDSAQTNVMCIYIGQYYPASATSPDIIYTN